MFKIIRFYNQNRKEIFIVLISMILITVFISRLNTSIEKTQEAQEEERRSSEEIATSSIQRKEILEKELTEEEFNKFEEIVDEFVKYCNLGQTDKAYELLSDECKNEVYPEFKVFEDQYYKEIFECKKNYQIKDYLGSTYKIIYTEDMLASGKTNNLKKQEDYITFNNAKDGSYKLNIGGFIESKKIEKSITDKDIIIDIQKINRFVEDEEYIFNIDNRSEKNIKLKKEDIIIIDTSDIRYEVQGLTEDIVVESKSKVNRKVKFSNQYINDMGQKSLYIKIKDESDNYYIEDLVINL